MEGRIVIRGAVVPPAGAGATVVVEGRFVAAVVPPGRPVEPRPGDWDVEAAGRLLVPGLVDAHAHLALGALERLAGLPGRPPPTVADLRAGHRRPLEARATPELLEPLARAGAVAALRAGVTTAFDLVRAAPGAAAEALLAVERGLAAAGLRAVLAYGASGPGGAAELEAGAAFAAARAAAPRVRGQAGLYDVASASDEVLARAGALGAEHGLHVCAGEDEGDLAHAYQRFGKRAVEALAERGLLGRRTLVAHGATAVHGEGVALADAGATLAVTPRAAMFWGAPFPPVLPFAAIGVPIAFGTDGLFPDVAGEAVAAAMMLRHAERSAGAAAGLVGRVAWPTAARLVADAFGAPAGAIEPGALADLVLLDWRPALPLPAVPGGDLALLWAGAPAAWVLVDGEVRLREGRLLAGDEGEIAARARDAAARLLAA